MILQIVTIFLKMKQSVNNQACACLVILRERF
jgi:hypothetical protein